MKKFLLVFSLLVAFVFATSAQAVIHTFKDGGGNNIAFVGAVTDTAGTTAGAQLTVSKVIDMRQATTPYYFYFTANITRISGNVAGHTVRVEGSNDNTTYTTLMNVTLSDAASAACVYTRSDTVAFGYPYLRVLLTSDGVGVNKLTSVYGKLVKSK
jgi:hypothetical protein